MVDEYEEEIGVMGKCPIFIFAHDRDHLLRSQGWVEEQEDQRDERDQRDQGDQEGEDVTGSTCQGQVQVGADGSRWECSCKSCRWSVPLLVVALET